MYFIWVFISLDCSFLIAPYVVSNVYLQMGSYKVCHHQLYLILQGMSSSIISYFTRYVIINYILFYKVCHHQLYLVLQGMSSSIISYFTRYVIINYILFYKVCHHQLYLILPVT